MTTTAAANTGDPLGHPGFVREEDEEEAVGEERYDSGSDDDDDVDRYMFLARPPAPAEASDDDEDDGAMPSGGGRGRKRRLSGILAHASPAAKKVLAAPRDASRSEGPVRSAERGAVLDQGKKNKKRHRSGREEPQVHPAASGKRSNGADHEARSEGSGHRTVTAGQTTYALAVAAAAAAGAPRRFVCSLCGRCFGSHQALGGHVHLGHTKKAKNAIAAASHADVTGDGCRNGKVAMVDGAGGHGKEKIAVAASPAESDGDGKKTLGAAACRQDVDSSSGYSDSNSDEEEMFIGAADHGDHRGDGNVEGEKVAVAVATSHDDTDGKESKFAVGRCAGAIGNANSIVRKTHYRCEVCGRECPSGQALGGHMRKHRKLSPHNGGCGGKERRSPEVADGAFHQHVVSSNEEEMFVGAANHGDGNGAERKVAVGRCRELAIGNASSNVRKTQYRCEVCGKKCHSGQALGGHMRKHRKRSPQDDGGKERTSPEADGITNQRAVVIKSTQYGTRFDESLIGWV